MKNLTPVASGCVAYWDGSSSFGSANELISGNVGIENTVYRFIYLVIVTRSVFSAPCLSAYGICNGHGICVV